MTLFDEWLNLISEMNNKESSLTHDSSNSKINCKSCNLLLFIQSDLLLKLFADWNKFRGGCSLLRKQRLIHDFIIWRQLKLNFSNYMLQFNKKRLVAVSFERNWLELECVCHLVHRLIIFYIKNRTPYWRTQSTRLSSSNSLSLKNVRFELNKLRKWWLQIRYNFVDCAAFALTTK